MKQVLGPLSLTISLLLPATLSAQGPIKSLDASGNVTYSDRPTTDAVSSEEIAIEPGPTEEQIEAAKERTDRLQNQADEARSQRESLSQQRAAEQESRPKKEVESEPETVKPSGYYGTVLPGSPPVRPQPPIARPPINRPSPR